MTVDESTGTLVMQKEPETPSAEESPAATEPGAPAVPTKARRGAGRILRFLRVGAGVWVGLFLVAAGFGLIAYTWGEIAGLLDVSLQLPYLASGGLTGIGLILLGLLVTNLAVKRREALERSRQLDEIREALVRLRTAIEDEPSE
jgi:hypothetical protein